MPTPTRTALLTGFEPFGGLRENPSAALLPAFEGREIAGVKVTTAVLPVRLASLTEQLAGHVMAHRPALVLGLGLAAGAAAIAVETVGINRLDFSIPDNDGLRPPPRPIVRDGPAARFSTFEAEAVRDAMLAAGVPARVSVSAGTYLCNMALYMLIGLVGATTPAGFQHLPYMPEQSAALARAGERQPPPSMAPEVAARGVEAALAVMARQATAPIVA